MEEKRIFKFNKKTINKNQKYVLYWIQNSLRLKYNYALKFAIEKANILKKPILVYFVLKEFPLGNLRQYEFLRQGILEFKNHLENLGANFLVEKGDFDLVLKKAQNACLVICDCGYLKKQRFWREKIAASLQTAFYEIESDVLIPLKLVSSKKVTYAFQIRKKVFDLLATFVKDFYIPEIKNKQKILEQSISEIDNLFNSLKIDKKVKPTIFIGGESQARKKLLSFIEKKLRFYKDYRNNPAKDYQSNLSPYLHFGFISDIEIVKLVLDRFSIKNENVKSFLNELLVWRILARIFVLYEKNYKSWRCLPEWAVQTLDLHSRDRREYLYDLDTLEKGQTHDPYWNAAQKEMVLTGKMHNYMRMYWAKKVIEWTSDWRKAFKWLIYLNDKYELDGRDPNGYLGIAWSFGKFDRPWFERPIFGKIRYLSGKSLEKKFDMLPYLNKFKDS
ncbi:MAG: deoxyribodipyrimidine photo-lyase [Patescibacteria group bacterium]|nr:MAG: deoxyribodipyrimidine photo-lyase [Patescibacteria group bacterium]